MRDWKLVKLSPSDSLLVAMKVIDLATFGIGLVVDEAEHLVGIAVDGDIRRAVLKGISLETPVEKIMNAKPVTAPPGQTRETYLDLMLATNIQQVPLVKPSGQVVGLELLKDLRSELVTGIKAVIMAGGLGSRLRPLTDSHPKPLLPVGNRPIMEHVLERLHGSGIREVVVSTHYKSEMIEEHFGDGSSCGLTIKYVKEENRFGTIGALRLMREQLKETFLVMNGDVLTTLDFSAIQQFHRNQDADMTVAVKKHSLYVPYGVVQVQNETVLGLEEKPTLSVFINAGIYLINPDMIDFIPEGQAFDATDLIGKLIKEGRHVAAFPVIEYWMDIGHPTDYEQADADVRAGRMGERLQ